MDVRRTIRRMTALFGAMVFSVVGVFAATAPAAAAEVDVIVPGSITITNESGANRPELWDIFRVNMQINTTGVTVAAGDTFTVQLPTLLSGLTGSFDVMNADETATVATCSVTSRDGSTGGSLACTFTNYFDDHQDVVGSLWFRAQVVQTTADTSVEFVVNGVAEYIDLPGDGGVVPGPLPSFDNVDKMGWFQEAGGSPDTMMWQIYLPGPRFPVGSPIEISDVFPGQPSDVTAYRLIPGTIYLQYFENLAAWESQTVTAELAAGETGAVNWSFTPNASLTGFTASIDHNDPDGYYRLIYRTELLHPDLIQPGMIVGNTAVVNGGEVSETIARQPQGGGTADGPGTGSFGIIKDALQGSGAGLVDPTATYTVNATYTLNGEALTVDFDGAPLPTSFELTAGGTAAVQDRLPTGTVVTLTEVVPTDTARFDWQDPTIVLYQGENSTPSVSNSVTFTIQEQARTTVEIRNTVNGVPSIDIEKWSSAGTPTYDATGALTNDGALGDYDVAAAPETLDPLAPTTITFTISNDGTENLTNIAVTEETIVGTAALENLTCTFPDATTGTTWAGTLAPGQRFTCVGTLPALGEINLHADTATVVAVGETSGTEVTDTDNYNAATPLLPRVSVGDFVWEDTDRDGIQDSGEPGIPDVTLTLTGPDGGPVTDAAGNPVGPTTTDADGAYIFTNLPALPAGQSYTVTVTPPTGYEPTVAEAGSDRAVDSSTGSAASWLDLSLDGAHDATLDFGFVTPLSPTPPTPPMPPAPPAPVPPAPVDEPQELAATGANTSPLVIGALASMTAGLAIVAGKRRATR